MQENPYASSTGHDAHEQKPTRGFLALWFCNLPYFFWTMFGFGVGWATTNILWRFRVLNPWWDDPFTFTSIFGPMVLASLYATRKAKRYRVRLPLLTVPTAWVLYIFCPAPSILPVFLNHMLLNEHVPYIIAPWVAVAGLLAIAPVEFHWTSDRLTT